MQDINTLKRSIKHLYISDSIHGKGGHETKAYGPQFLLYNRKHFILRVQKTGNGAEWEKKDIMFTKFKEWSITHTWARESSNIYKTIDIDLSNVGPILTAVSGRVLP